MTHIKETKQVSTPQKLFYGLGGAGDGIMGGVIFVLAMKIYNWEFGIDAGLIGLALLVPRLWDAVTDPFMGSISDNTRTRWGRRRPYIFWGAVLTGLLCMAVWSPPLGLGKTGLFWYLLIVSTLFFTAYTVFVIPYSAMGFELTTNFHERTSVMAYKIFFVNFVNLTLMSIAYKLCRWEVLGETPVQAVRVVGIAYGALIILFGIIPAIFCHTKEIQPSSAPREKVNIVKAVEMSLGNKPYIIIVVSSLLLVMGIYLVSQLGGFLTLAYVFEGNKDKVANLEVAVSICYGVAGLLGTVIAPAITKRFGKHQTALGTVVVLAIAFAFSFFYITPKYPYLQIISALFMSPGMTIFIVAISSMMADTIDYDEYRTGTRREGSFVSLSAFTTKVSLALALGVSGLLVNLSGFVPEATVQSEKTILALRLMYALVPVGFLVIVYILMRHYSLTENRVHEIQGELAKGNSGGSLNE